MSIAKTNSNYDYHEGDNCSHCRHGAAWHFVVKGASRGVSAGQNFSHIPGDLCQYPGCVCRHYKDQADA